PNRWALELGYSAVAPEMRRPSRLQEPRQERFYPRGAVLIAKVGRCRLRAMIKQWRAGLSALRRRLGRGGSQAALGAANARAELAEARLGAVLDALPEGVVLLDDGGRYVLWNRAYAEMYHGSADLFEPGKRLIDVLRMGVQRGDYPE